MVKTLHGTLDRNGAGCTVGEFVLASDYAALEARCWELERCLDGGVDCANERIEQKQHIVELEAALRKLSQTCNGELGCKGYRVDEDLNLTASETDVESQLIARNTKETLAEVRELTEFVIRQPWFDPITMVSRSSIKVAMEQLEKNRGAK